MPTRYTNPEPALTADRAAIAAGQGNSPWVTAPAATPSPAAPVTPVPSGNVTPAMPTAYDPNNPNKPYIGGTKPMPTPGMNPDGTVDENYYRENARKAMQTTIDA